MEVTMEAWEEQFVVDSEFDKFDELVELINEFEKVAEEDMYESY